MNEHKQQKGIPEMDATTQMSRADTLLWAVEQQRNEVLTANARLRADVLQLEADKKALGVALEQAMQKLKALEVSEQAQV